MSMIKIPGEERLFYDTATKTVYERQENGDFNAIRISGAALSSTAGDFRGDYPENALTVLVYTVPSTVAVLTSDLSIYSWGEISISGLTGGDLIAVLTLSDGTNSTGNLTTKGPTGTMAAATALANGKYQFALASKVLSFAKSADAGADATVTLTLKRAGAPL
jgi:hypothetical protein